MYDEIVIPLDGSPAAAAAIPFAARLPSERVRLVRVEPPFQRIAPGPLSEFRPDWREIREDQVRAELSRQAAPLRAAPREEPPDVTSDIRFGDVFDELMDATDSADLIVLTTFGRGMVSRALFGSVSDRMIRYSTRPTLVVRPGQEDRRPLQVVAPLDGSAIAEAAIPEAVRLAMALRVPLHLVEVLDAERIMPDPATPDAETVVNLAWSRVIEDAERYLTTHEDQLRERDRLTVTHQIIEGAAATVLLDMIQPTDVVVLASHGRGSRNRQYMLGGVADKLVRAAAAPVLLVHPTDVDGLVKPAGPRPPDSA